MIPSSASVTPARMKTASAQPFRLLRSRVMRSGIITRRNSVSWLARVSMPSSVSELPGGVRQGRGEAARIGRVDGEPGHALFLPEPGPLSFRVAPGAALRQGDRLLEADLAAQVLERLMVPDRLEGVGGLGAACPEQPAYLLDQARGEEAHDARVDDPVEGGAFHVETDLHRGVPIRPERRLPDPFGQAAARGEEDLQ